MDCSGKESQDKTCSGIGIVVLCPEMYLKCSLHDHWQVCQGQVVLQQVVVGNIECWNSLF